MAVTTVVRNNYGDIDPGNDLHKQGMADTYDQVWIRDNIEIEVSRRRKDEFLVLLSDFYVNSGKLK